jgi:hypothetical protein
LEFGVVFEEEGVVGVVVGAGIQGVELSELVGW